MRITGTHIYGMLRCRHSVVLDLTEDRSKRRPITEIEEFVRRRGRDFEAEFVAGLAGFVEPEYERGDFDRGAGMTLAFLRQGVPGVCQGVLVDRSRPGPVRLGIPDLLRRVPGGSDLGGHHYEVGDIKTSGRPRSDQLLQVLFYSRLLGDLQGRQPEHGFLILKDGREERFLLEDYRAAFEHVEEQLVALAADPQSSEPFYSSACGKCHWSELCLPRLRDRSDLSLVQGMTRGLRTTLRRAGVDDVRKLSAIPVEPTAERTHLEPVLLRRLKKSAAAHLAGRPFRQAQSPQARLEEVAVLHHLHDPFSDRMLFFGARFPGESGAPRSDWEFCGVCPADRESERDAFLRLVEQVPGHLPLVHYGDGLPRWLTETGRAEKSAGIERRFVDLARRLRGAAIYPGPVFGLASHVEYALRRDPHRNGHAAGAALYGTGDAGDAWLMTKGRSDLEDLCDLVDYLRAVEEVPVSGAVGGTPENGTHQNRAQEGAT